MNLHQEPSLSLVVIQCIVKPVLPDRYVLISSAVSANGRFWTLGKCNCLLWFTSFPSSVILFSFNTYNSLWSKMMCCIIKNIHKKTIYATIREKTVRTKIHERCLKIRGKVLLLKQRSITMKISAIMFQIKQFCIAAEYFICQI